MKQTHVNLRKRRTGIRRNKMSGIIPLLILEVYFYFVSIRSGRYRPEERTLKITKPLSVMIGLSPLIGTVIFAVLFVFVLKGRLSERATHAFLVFAVWMYATRFYQYILAYYKKKEILACSAAGVLFSVALAFVFTPLDRYVSLIYSRIDWYAVFLGLGLYAVFYAAAFITAEKRRREDDE